MSILPMSPVVVVAVVLKIPVAFVEGVAAIITVIVGMGPIRAPAVQGGLRHTPGTQT